MPEPQHYSGHSLFDSCSSCLTPLLSWISACAHVCACVPVCISVRPCAGIGGHWMIKLSQKISRKMKIQILAEEAESRKDLETDEGGG